MSLNLVDQERVDVGGLEKVHKYYQKTSDSNAYTFAMVLNPTEKLSYFQKHWPDDLQREAEAQMEDTFKQRYLQLHGSSTVVPVPIKKPATSKMRRSVVLDDDDTDMPGMAELLLDPLKPWLNDLKLYLTTREVVHSLFALLYFEQNFNHAHDPKIESGGVET
ncbi:hypothetical protein B0H13DRAFT_2303628 [Mycena leptocephala]|nr:hypothetical protein B0H13DRAFT_2303628 [Mycena leptocephala]